ncbi:restriction endonuclease subunit S [Polaribacter sp.]|nr:restriction endonuclease subunit S [Polaribacter sp.]
MKEDWIECMLGEILSVSSGKGLTSKKMDGGIYPVYGGNGITGYHSQKIFSEQKLIIGRVGVRCGVTHITQEKSWVTDNALIVNFKSSDFDLKFMKLKLEFENLNKLSNSTAQPVISGTKIYSHSISLPPLVEQKAIVKKLEELFSSLESGITDLKKAQDQLVIYRQAVLKKAFEGELTKEWREKQTNLPSADELLEQIKEERQKHYDQQLADWKEAAKTWEKKGKEGKKPKKPAILKSELDLSKLVQKLTDLPNKWCYINLDFAVYKLGDGLHGTPKYSETGDYYFINGNNLANGKINIKPNTKRVDYSEFLKYRKDLNADTIFVSINGTIGNVSFYNNEKVILGKSACYFNLLSGFNKNYIKWRIDSLDFKNYAFKNATGSTIKNVPLRAMRNYTFALCSKEEQYQIVQEIESRLSVCDTVEKDIVDSLEKAQALRQSILKKAFEGKLLSEEEIAQCKAHAAYEPASVLLKKIMAEKKKK